MKKDLRSAVLGNQAKQAGFDGFDPADKDKAETIKRMYDEYAGKDEKELYEKLFQMTKQGKKDGSLNNSDIDTMAQRIAPMLDDEKRARLNSIIDMLKK